MQKNIAGDWHRADIVAELKKGLVTGCIIQTRWFKPQYIKDGISSSLSKR